MKMITATEANRDFSKLLEQVENGEAIGITKHGKIVASLVPAAVTLEDMEGAKLEHLAELRSRKAISGLQRGTRDELYDD
jgi:prevent-host-death family protein